MKIIFILLLSLFFFSPDAVPQVVIRSDSSLPSMQEQYRTGNWIAVSTDNKLTVIGVSNPLLRRQDEITAAKEDAARKIAMYYGIQANMEVTNRTGFDFFDYEHESNIEIKYDTNFEKYIDQLTFDPENDVLRTSEAVFIRFKYNTSVEGINYSVRIENDRPSWTRNQNKPDFEGYVTVVGFSRNQRRLKDTILKSIENAVVRMIEETSTTVKTREVSAAGQGSSGFIHAISEGTLSNFMVIEFWVEPQTRFVYTLAIARIVE